MNSLIEIAEQLKDNDEFLIIGHLIPDGDCIGSILGLYMGLISLNKKVNMFLSDDTPDIYQYLSHIEKINNFLPPAEKMKNIIFLDCSDEERIDKKIAEQLNRNATIINIDHHESNSMFGHYNYVDIKAAATAQIIYELLLTMNISIDEEMANALYAGIVMDTGSFKYTQTNSKTHMITAALLEKGVDLEKARINLFESKPIKEVLLLGKALKNFNISANGKIAWMLLPYAEIEAIDAHGLHPEGIINYTRMIDGVEVGLLFREIKPGLIKIGLRSKRDINVAEIAGNFGGGGHKQAAGASLEGDITTVCNTVVKYVEKMVF